ncbi:MAG TPA: hypothetical protein VKV69_13560 [Actinomycetota bacterium]|nr:hypothetical protein [Actinomycetota bacterium]
MIAGGLLPADAETSRASSRLTPSAGASVVVSVPSGSLAISTSGNEVTLRRRPGNGNTTRYEATLPRIQVTDTRAQQLGWLVQVSFAAPSSVDPSSARLFVHPNQPTIVSGDARGVRKGQPGWTSFGSEVSLFWAEQGAGRGTYSDDETVVLVVPRSDAPSITLMFGASAY